MWRARARRQREGAERGRRVPGTCTPWRISGTGSRLRGALLADAETVLIRGFARVRLAIGIASR
ncbi:hypothetical protein A6302_02260 [Methylobrevis pamukkalensis]|uniref:Uncharacterized protein n=1 Tax=Methylobrevis pamukkalensis TaxID=1439726 RepID=A0A1E3H253_9HYPH|nr:hypothetical protein A6302_02260 [Methylobrevis pamukkalensis]